MKKYFSKSKFIALLAITLVTTTVAASVFTVKLKNDTTPDLEYVGDVNNLPVYRLSLKNKTNDRYFVSVTDREGNVIYCQEVEGANIVSNYQFNSQEHSDEYELTLTVTDLKGKTVASYDISKSNKVVSEVSVNEVK